jgi:O-acetyl-ADP-ribose deacetylase (regulator of RNase III)
MSELIDRANRIGARFDNVAQLVVRHGTKAVAMPYLAAAVRQMNKATRRRSADKMLADYDAIDKLLDQAADTILAKTPE